MTTTLTVVTALTNTTATVRMGKMATMTHLHCTLQPVGRMCAVYIRHWSRRIVGTVSVQTGTGVYQRNSGAMEWKTAETAPMRWTVRVSCWTCSRVESTTVHMRHQSACTGMCCVTRYPTAQTDLTSGSVTNRVTQTTPSEYLTADSCTKGACDTLLEALNDYPYPTIVGAPLA